MIAKDYEKLINDLKIIMKYARDGISRDDKEYKDICLRLIRHYIIAEIMMEDVDDYEWNWICKSNSQNRIRSLKTDCSGLPPNAPQH